MANESGPEAQASDRDQPISAPPSSFSIPEAGLLVSEVRIRNFRALGNVVLPLESPVTYLVGENNAGKSSALLAVATACGSRRATLDDLHQQSEGRTANTAEIDLLIQSSEAEFPEVVGQRLEGNYGPGPGPGEWMGIRTTLEASSEGPFLTWHRTLLLWEVANAAWVDSGIPLRDQVLQLLVAQTIGASRDLTDDLVNKSSDWGRILSDLGFSQADRDALQIELQSLGARLQGASPVLDSLAKHLSELSKAQTGVAGIDLRPLPPQIDEVGRSLDVVVSSPGGPELPLRFQGLGMRSLASIMVFRALCELRVGADRGIQPHIVTLLEEPEAHLHPQAQAAVREIIEDLPGQSIVATHSDVLVADCHPRAVRIFRTTPGGPAVHALDLESAKKIAVFRRYVERPLGELFFARMAIFVDGTAERIAIPQMLRPLLDASCAGAGISLIDLEGMNKEQLQKAVDALKALGDVPWIVFLDNDADGWSAISGVTGSDGSNLSKTHPQVILSGDKQLEQLLLDSGYGDEIRDIANTYLPRTREDPEFPAPRLPEMIDEKVKAEYLKFLKGNKGWAAELIAKRAVSNGKKMPSSVIELAERIRGVLGMPEPRGEIYRAARGEDQGIIDGST